MIRADASQIIGTGHIMRCLALADELAAAGYAIAFVNRGLEGNMHQYIEERGHRSLLLSLPVPLALDDTPAVQEDAEHTIQYCVSIQPDWLIVDHYALDNYWESMVRPYAGKLLVIDDLANRKHAADILLDQNLAENPELRYQQLVPSGCRLLLGPAYLLLRPSFYEQRAALKRRGEAIRRLLVFFGGSDPTNETAKVLEALREGEKHRASCDQQLQVDVVVGNANPYLEEIRRVCMDLQEVTLHIQIEYMAELIAEADFAFGAGGVAMWERCYLGLPAAVAIVADNQADTVKLAGQLGAVMNMGWHAQINSGHYADILNKVLAIGGNLSNMSAIALELMGSRPGQIHSRVMTVITEERLRDEGHSNFKPYDRENT
ncbi:UDP-2,4-diacetamido-2,4,6-trideoxy-beta-L-altropyranose hydrolase [Paenibacillus sp. KS-LC4]|uniref:UDP-2,4-diacetamido-2,4, 6-trideoxy-beta-L-altropyranose hydrolase n=1 Tax=Paenibacillus sp. KS-LC4 TaxID=2979727 RepID=UPI0030CEE1AB